MSMLNPGEPDRVPPKNSIRAQIDDLLGQIGPENRGSNSDSRGFDKGWNRQWGIRLEYGQNDPNKEDDSNSTLEATPLVGNTDDTIRQPSALQ